MDRSKLEQMEDEALGPMIQVYQMGVETLMLAYMAESGLGLDKIEPVTTQEGLVIRTYIRKKGV